MRIKLVNGEELVISADSEEKTMTVRVTEDHIILVGVSQNKFREEYVLTGKGIENTSEAFGILYELMKNSVEEIVQITRATREKFVRSKLFDPNTVEKIIKDYNIEEQEAEIIRKIFEK